MNKYKKHHKTINDLSKWYPVDYASINIDAARIMCQRVNIYWDSEVRQNLINILKIILGLYILGSVAFLCYENMGFAESMVSFILPLSSIVIYIIRKIEENVTTMMNLQKLSGMLEGGIWNLAMNHNSSKEDLEKASKMLQNMLFKHRSSCALIWDFFYSWRRKQQENNSNYEAKQIVNKFNI